MVAEKNKTEESKVKIETFSKEEISELVTQYTKKKRTSLFE